MSEQRHFAADNLRLAFAALKGFANDAAVLDDMPEGTKVKVISFPANDQDLLEHNIRVVATDIARTMAPDTEIDISVRRPKQKPNDRTLVEEPADDSWRIAPASV